MPLPRGVKKVESKTVGKFTIKPWDTKGVGERILIYGEGGVGKSTLASLASRPIIIPLSDGAKEIRKPNGDRIDCVFGIETFQDLRNALVEPSLWENYDTIIIDDFSELEVLAEQHVVDTYPAPKNRSKVTSLRHFGFDGMGYLVETMRLILNDLDSLVYQNKNVAGVAHSHLVKIASAEGFDYVQGGPKLAHNSQYSVRDTVYNWMDCVVQIDFADKVVTRDEKEKSGKIEASDERIIFTQKSAQYLRKSRQLKSTGKALPSEISFTSPADSSFWEFVKGAEVEA